MEEVESVKKRRKNVMYVYRFYNIAQLYFYRKRKN